METRLLWLSPFPPFDSLATDRPRLHYSASHGVRRFPRIASRPLRGIICTIEDLRSGLAPTIALIAIDQIPDETRWRAIQDLVRTHVPSRPVFGGRLREFRERDITDEDIRRAAIALLPQAPWDEELVEEFDGEHGVWLHVDVNRLRSYLNREITHLLLGPAARQLENSKRALPLDALPIEKLSRTLSRAVEEASRTLSHASLKAGKNAVEEHLLRGLAEELEEQIKKQAELTEAESQVWDLYRRGFTPKEIAEETGRKAPTARVHLHNAREKLVRAVQAVI